MLKHRTFWIILVISLLAAGGGAVLFEKQSISPSVTMTKVPVVLEFLPSDVMEITFHDLRQSLSLSGSLRAVKQASVKAKVGGEVREVLAREGEVVKQGQILVRMDGSEYRARVEQAKGSLLAARAQLDIAAKTRANNQALLDKGFISRNAFDNATSQYEVARANVESAKGALNVVQKSLTDTVILAPISGVISSRTVQPGEKVSPDNHLLDIVDLYQMEMEAAAPVSDIQQVALGQEVQVQVEGASNPLVGKVTRINPATEAGSRSIMVYVQIDNPQGILRAGMFGEAQLTIAKKTGVLTIPQSAVQANGGNTYVYAIENDKLVQKPVTLGIKGDNGHEPILEIISGLHSGAQVVKTNLGNLHEGMSVKFIKTTS